MASGVSLIINTYNQAHFLAQSVGSALAQTVRPDEIIVVDDGSPKDDPGPALAAFPEVRLIRQANQGLAGARNTGLRAARGEFITFLDADDRLTPQAFESGLACLRAIPAAGLAFGGHRGIDLEGRALPGETFNPIDGDPTLALLTHGNVIGMHATVLYRRQLLLDQGGFDAALRACEDYDLYLRLSAVTPFAQHPTIIAEYRQHGDQMSRDHEMMRRLAFEVIDRQLGRRDDADSRRAAAIGRRNIDSLYTLAAFRSSGLRLLTGRGQPGDVAQALAAFRAFPLDILGVMAKKASRVLGIRGSGGS